MGKNNCPPYSSEVKPPFCYIISGHRKVVISSDIFECLKSGGRGYRSGVWQSPPPPPPPPRPPAPPARSRPPPRWCRSWTRWLCVGERRAESRGRGSTRGLEFRRTGHRKDERGSALTLRVGRFAVSVKAQRAPARPRPRRATAESPSPAPTVHSQGVLPVIRRTDWLNYGRWWRNWTLDDRKKRRI